MSRATWKNRQIKEPILADFETTGGGRYEGFVRFDFTPKPGPKCSCKRSRKTGLITRNPSCPHPDCIRQSNFLMP